MVGSAVLVTLPSRAERRSGIHIAMKERQKPSVRTHFWLGSSEGSEIGIIGRLKRRVRPCGMTGG